MLNLKYAFLTTEFLTNISRAALFIYASIVIIHSENGIGWITVLLSAEAIFLFVAPLLSGALIDKKGSAYILRRVSVLILLLLLIIAVLKVTDYIDDISTIILLTLSMNVASPFLKHAVFTFTTTVFAREHIKRGNALFTLNMQAGQIIGMFIAPVLVAIFLPQILIWIYCIVYSVILILYFDMTKGAKDNLNDEISQKNFSFFSFLKIDVSTKVILASSFELALVTVFNICLVMVIDTLFKKNATLMSNIDIAFAIGAFLAGWTGSKNTRYIQSFSTYLSPLIFSITFLSFLFTDIYLSIFLCFLWGYFMSISNIFWKSKLHHEVPQNQLGRASGLRGFFVAIICLVTLPFLRHLYTINLTAVVVAVSLLGLIFSLFIVISRSTTTNLSKLPSL